MLAAAFALLDASEPIVTEFDESIADRGDEMLACPLPPRHDPDAHPAVDEARGLRAAYDRGVELSNGRIAAGRVVAADDIGFERKVGRSLDGAESPAVAKKLADEMKLTFVPFQSMFDKAIEDNHSLGTVLRGAGYATALVGKWGLQGSGGSPAAWPAGPCT